MVKYKTYSNAFKWKTVIYSINDLKLPFPIVVEQVVYFFGTLFLMLLIWGIFHVRIVNALVHFVGIPVAVTMMLDKLNPEDKTPLKWMRDWLMHLTQDPEEQWNFENPEHHEEGGFDSCAYRR